MLKDLTERLLQQRLETDEKRMKFAFLVVGFIFIFLILYIVYLNFLLLKLKSENSNYQKAESENRALQNFSVSPTPTPPKSEDTPVIYTQNNAENSSVKDYFVSFGSGINSSNDWTDVGGLQAIVDLANFGNIKEIRFEASVYVPTENQAVSVRLFNKTDKHPVWGSEVTMSGGPSGYLVSNPISFDKGEKTYQVQMKTQLQYQANLGQARLHIILK